MNILKRVFLYLATNILVVVTISFITNALGLHGYLTPHGIDYQALAMICLLWGMTGSIIALLLSRWTAKKFMNVKLIEPGTRVQTEKELVQSVYQLARRAGLSTMPEVGIYHASEVNAFATGATRNRSLVAVSSGLLTQMNADELEGVLGHEISHIANGDMVTMTLLQGVVNAFSLFLSRLLAYTVSEMLARHDKDGRHRNQLVYGALVFLFDILITLLGSLVIAAFSRYREYRADQGGARLAGRQKMVAALKRLRAIVMPQDSADVVAPLKINNKRSRFFSWLSSHPDIDLRIAALQERSS